MRTSRRVLTEEERDILLLVTQHPGGEHLSTSKIAQRLGISVSRVKTLMHQACVKLGADTRAEAVFFALKRGEISANEFLSLDEMAEILDSLGPEGPDMLRRIAHLVRQEQSLGQMPEMDERISPIIPPARRQPGILTNRERDVLTLASRGLTNLEIADRLCMSSSAVGTFLKRAFTKLGTRRRADAVVLAQKQGETSPTESFSFDEILQLLAPLGAESIEEMAQLLDDRMEKPPRSTGS
jgi:DNA-binding CsgD family transcriptional regulator